MKALDFTNANGVITLNDTFTKIIPNPILKAFKLARENFVKWTLGGQLKNREYTNATNKKA